MIIDPTAAPSNWWLRLGTAGTGLTLVVLGASMLLRLATEWAADGQAQSVLPPVVEHATRLAHRLAASGVSLVALCAVLLAWMQRRTNRRMVSITACLVAATVVLAGIGPLTPGYRVAAITVLNVGVGMVLLLAFWWMRESSARMPYQPWVLPRVARLALAALILHTATGAAASAYRMQGLSWPAWVHLASAVLFIGCLAALVIAQRRLQTPPKVHTLRILMAAQVLLGACLFWLDHRPVWLNFTHALLSPLLAMALLRFMRSDELPRLIAVD